MKALRWTCAVFCLAVGTALAQPSVQPVPDAQAGEDAIARAYRLLAAKDYDRAIEEFRAGLRILPDRAAVHKDLAYALLKVGENEEARDEFQEAMKIDRSDETATLEFAFLCYETKKPVEARRTFDRLRQYGSSATRATAEQAFQNIDRPLAAGIQRWKEALASSPNAMTLSMYSAHYELAQLAEQRDELELAAREYEICRSLKLQMPSLLIDLARIWQQLNRVEEARAALLAASRSTESRTAERALELLGPRYPYVYEFQQSLTLDPQNVPLRRELAYLYLAMNKDAEAMEQFERVLAIQPDDKLSVDQLAALRAAKARPQLQRREDSPGADRPKSLDPKAMGRKSLTAGYIPDALRYLRLAYETDPQDPEVLLQLGWAYNAAKQDGEAIRWFGQARRTENAAVADEAKQAYRNLKTGGLPQFTTWALPMYSSRWNNLFGYGQVKHNLPFLQRAPVQFYVSSRFVGDVKRYKTPPVNGVPLGTVPVQFLSENSFILGVGASTRTWHRLTGWAEAGLAVRYLPYNGNMGRAVSDYRGGLNYAHGFGHLLGSKNPGWFSEHTADAVFISRFDKNWLFYSQNRAGYTLPLGERSSAQFLWNYNRTFDAKEERWARLAEFGPGFRLHLPWMPRSGYAFTDVLRFYYPGGPSDPTEQLKKYGVHTPPGGWDVRVGLWYAFSK